MKRGSSSLPCETARYMPMPSFWHSLGPRTLISRPCCLASLAATSAIFVGVRSPAGSLMRSRARATAAATCYAALRAALERLEARAVDVVGRGDDLHFLDGERALLVAGEVAIELVAAEERALGEELRGALGRRGAGATLEVRQHGGGLRRLRGGGGLDDARGEAAQVGGLRSLRAPPPTRSRRCGPTRPCVCSDSVWPFLPLNCSSATRRVTARRGAGRRP